MSDDPESKTEEPSQRRLEEARKKGQVVVSQEVKLWFSLIGALLVVMVFAPSGADRLARVLQAYLTTVAVTPTDPGTLFDGFKDAALQVALVLAPPLATIVALSVVAGIVQTGPMASTEALKPKFSKINPVSGFKRIFSGKALIEFAKGLAKIAVVGIIAVMILRPYGDGMDHFIGLPIAGILDESRSISVSLMGAVVVLMTAIGLLDYMHQRFQFMKQHRMTKEEVKEEYKESEGDPHIKGRLRQIRMERSRTRMMAAVPTADVVVTNPTHFAVALKYAPEEMAAPRVVAKGADNVAAKIREIARENDVPVMENRPLAQALYKAVDIDGEIPAEHYKAVAEVISFVFRKRRGPGGPPGRPAGNAPARPPAR